MPGVNIYTCIRDVNEYDNNDKLNLEKMYVFYCDLKFGAMSWTSFIL